MTKSIIKTKNNKCLSVCDLIKENKINDLKELIKNKQIDPNQRDLEGKSCSFTPLYWSVKLGSLDAVELLLSSGADPTMVVNDPLECYGTPLDLATILGYDEIEDLIRRHLNKDIESYTFSFKAIRTKLRSKNTLSFNFKSKKTIEKEEAEKLNKKAA